MNTVSQAHTYKLYSLPSDWQRLPVDMTVNSLRILLALDHGEELFPKLRTPTGRKVQVKNKTQNWAIH